MSKLNTIILIVLLLMFVTLPSIAQNPFTSKKSPSQDSPAMTPPNPFLAKIAFWQHQLNQKMAALTRESKETGSLRPLLLLFMIAFTYGMLHAAGPGHGKAIAMSYIISRGKKLRNGILFGNLIAFFHGLSGVVIVLVLHLVLQKGVSGPFESVSRTIQLISYSLIALLGAILFIKTLFLWIRQNFIKRPNNTESVVENQKSLLVMALIVGMVPCPGVVFVMLFALSLNMIGLGLMLSFFQTLGMSVTISAVIAVAFAGKNLSLDSIKQRTSWGETLEYVIEAVAGLMVMIFGLLFLAATL